MNKEGGRLSVLLTTVENSRRIGCTSDTGYPHMGRETLAQNVAHLRTSVLDGEGVLGLVPGCSSLLQGPGTAFHPGACGLMSDLLSTEREEK